MILPLALRKSFRPQVPRVLACSKGVIGIFIPIITSIGIVPKLVSKQPRFGIVNWPIKSIGKARRGSRPVLIKLSVTAIESSRRKPTQWPNYPKTMPMTTLARAITKKNPKKNLAVNGPVATNSSIPILAHPIKNTADLNVTRLCEQFSCERSGGKIALHCEKKRSAQRFLSHPMNQFKCDQHRWSCQASLRLVHPSHPSRFRCEQRIPKAWEAIGDA